MNSTEAVVKAIDDLCELRGRLAVATDSADRMEIVGELEDAKFSLLAALHEFAVSVRS